MYNTLEDLCDDLSKIDIEAAEYVKQYGGLKGVNGWSLSGMFVWAKTHQGFNYWNGLDKKLSEMNKVFDND